MTNAIEMLGRGVPGAEVRDARALETIEDQLDRLRGVVDGLVADRDQRVEDEATAAAAAAATPPEERVDFRLDRLDAHVVEIIQLVTNADGWYKTPVE